MSASGAIRLGMMVLICLGASLGASASRAAEPSASTIGTLKGKTAERVAKIVPGKSTKADVRSLLGAPWRTVQYNDLDQLENEIWEYRVGDASGSYRVHIEFDHQDVVHIVGKIPDAASPSNGTPARSSP
jgi:hypothetical protein